MPPISSSMATGLYCKPSPTSPLTLWEMPGACGVWSCKDIIAHLASFEHVLVDILATFLGSDPTPSLDLFRDPNGDFNDGQVALRKHSTVDEFWPSIAIPVPRP